MPLDTKVEGDPDTLTATCGWLRTQSQAAEAAGDQVYGARSDSETGWGNAAGESFRRVMTIAGQMSGTLVTSLSDTCTALETHADDLRTVRKKMEDARDVARYGGLEVSGYKIMEPGAAPAPAGNPPGRSASPQERQDYADAVHAQSVYQQKANAYAQAAQLVKEAKKKESESQHLLIRFLSGTFDPAKLSLTLTDMGTGMAAACAVRTSKYKAFAETAMDRAERASKLASSTNLSLANRTKAVAIQVTNELNAKDALDRAHSTWAARQIDRLPPRTKAVIRGMDTKLVPENVRPPNSLLRGAAKFGQRIPYVGLGITAVGVGMDIQGGKDPTQAIVSGGSSFVAGAMVGAAIGGPVGVVVGGLVGVGVGFAVDELWPD